MSSLSFDIPGPGLCRPRPFRFKSKPVAFSLLCRRSGFDLAATLKHICGSTVGAGPRRGADLRGAFLKGVRVLRWYRRRIPKLRFSCAGVVKASFGLCTRRRLYHPRVYLHTLTLRAGDGACQPGPVAVVTEVDGRLNKVVLEFAIEEYRECRLNPEHKKLPDTYHRCYGHCRHTNPQAPSQLPTSAFYTHPSASSGEHSKL